MDAIYEIPDAIFMKEPNKPYRTNTHIATAANQANGRLRNIRVAENVPYIAVAGRVPTIRNEAYGSVSGAAVNTDTEKPVDVDEIYEVPDAIGMKEPNKTYGTNTHIATAANEAYGRVRNIHVAENVPYMPVAEMVPTIQQKAYGSVSGAAVNTHTEEQDDVDEMYEIEIPGAIGRKEPNKAYETNTHIPTAANEAYGRVRNIRAAENVPYMPVAEMVPTFQYSSVSGAAVNTHTEEQDDVDEMYEIEIPGAIGRKEPNKAYETNTHIPTAANEAYVRVRNIRAAENVPVAEMVPTIQKAYGSVSGAAVNTDTEEQDDVDEIYDYMNLL